MVKKLVFFIFCFIHICVYAQLNIEISGIRNSSGNIRLAFYNNSKAFDDEKEMFTKTVSKSGIKNGIIKVDYKGLSPGIYGIAILDDENANEKMDYGLILPKEGFGFSDYYHSGMTRPKFEQFDFRLGVEAKTVKIVLRYL